MARIDLTSEKVRSFRDAHDARMPTSYCKSALTSKIKNLKLHVHCLLSFSKVVIVLSIRFILKFLLYTVQYCHELLLYEIGSV